MPKQLKKQALPIVYQAKSGAIELRGDGAHETIWATQAQIVQIFDVDQSVVSRHIRNIFKDGEVSEKSNMQKMHNANSDRPVTLYSLDVILGVGYRANSARAIGFRQWATKTLRQHITRGYTLNPKMIKHHYDEFQRAIENIKQLLPKGAVIDTVSVLELVTAFADTWLSLDAYDKDTLIAKGATKKTVKLTAEELAQALLAFRTELIKQSEATELFGVDRGAGGIAGIAGNVMQSFSGQALYPTIEEKAAHLLYFVIKNHPFADGNKRSGAYAFVWFLKKTGLLDPNRLTPPALTAITILIAESDPKNKERMIRLVLQVLRK
jgi:prophage maintenance system killer protein